MKHLKKIAERFRNSDQNAGGRISGVLRDTQRKAADYLNRKTADWSIRKTKIVFIIFFLVTGSATLFITGKAILSVHGPPKSLNVQRLYIPAPPNLQKQDSIKKKVSITIKK